MTSTTPVTVKLDVGGKKYKFSKALIEQYPTTMLARLVSETWNANDADGEIFVDRDGDTFRYVLSYMRDQKVFLPMNEVSKQTVLQELAYYGFEDVSDDAVIDGCARIAAAKSVVDNRQKHQDRVELLTYTLHYEIVAYECYSHYTQTGLFTVSLSKSSYNNNSNSRYSKAPTISSWNQVVLDKCLSDYGLKCVRSSFSLNNSVDITFALA